jgi:hypothetical protein
MVQNTTLADIQAVCDLLKDINRRLEARHPAGLPTLDVFFQDESQPEPWPVFCFFSYGTSAAALQRALTNTNLYATKFVAIMRTPPLQVRQSTVMSISARLFVPEQSGGHSVLRASSAQSYGPGSNACELAAPEHEAASSDGHASIFIVLMALGRMLKASRLRVRAGKWVPEGDVCRAHSYPSTAEEHLLEKGFKLDFKASQEEYDLQKVISKNRHPHVQMSDKLPSDWSGAV